MNLKEIAVKVPVEELRNKIETILGKLDMDRRDIEVVADALVKADLRGVATHGAYYLPRYLERVKEGTVKTKPKIKIIEEHGAQALIDGDHGFGQVIGDRAMDLAIEKANKTGVGFVGAKNTSDYGMAAYYSLKAVESDMIGITFCNTYPWVAPWGGCERLLGTNPISCAIPAKERWPIVLDMSTSAITATALVRAKEGGRKLPRNVAVDENGDFTTDPEEVWRKGAILPFGTYKGYGIALLIDILAGVLTGSAFGKEVKSLHQFGEFMTLGQCFIAIDPEKMIGIENFKERVDKEIEMIKGSKPSRGVKEVLLPGELEFLEEERRRREGIPIDEKLWKKLEELEKKPF